MACCIECLRQFACRIRQRGRPPEGEGDLIKIEARQVPAGRDGNDTRSVERDAASRIESRRLRGTHRHSHARVDRETPDIEECDAAQGNIARDRDVVALGIDHQGQTGLQGWQSRVRIQLQPGDSRVRIAGEITASHHCGDNFDQLLGFDADVAGQIGLIDRDQFVAQLEVLARLVGSNGKRPQPIDDWRSHPSRKGTSTRQGEGNRRACLPGACDGETLTVLHRVNHVVACHDADHWGGRHNAVDDHARSIGVTADKPSCVGRSDPNGVGAINRETVGRIRQVPITVGVGVNVTGGDDSVAVVLVEEVDGDLGACLGRPCKPSSAVVLSLVDEIVRGDRVEVGRVRRRDICSGKSEEEAGTVVASDCTRGDPGCQTLDAGITKVATGHREVDVTCRDFACTKRVGLCSSERTAAQEQFDYVTGGRSRRQADTDDEITLGRIENAVDEVGADDREGGSQSDHHDR